MARPMATAVQELSENKVKLTVDTHLKCIQDAHGDVNKMVRCG